MMRLISSPSCHKDDLVKVFLHNYLLLVIHWFNKATVECLFHTFMHTFSFSLRLEVKPANLDILQWSWESEAPSTLVQ